MKALVDGVLGSEGRIDLFASNAGIHIGMDAQRPGGGLATDRRGQLDESCVGRPPRAARDARRGEGHLHITASASSFLSEIASIGYATTKYAALGFGEWLAFSYRNCGLKVSVAVPGPVWTPLIQDTPYLHESAIPPEEAAERVLEGLVAGKFLITTHPRRCRRSGRRRRTSTRTSIPSSASGSTPRPEGEQPGLI